MEISEKQKEFLDLVEDPSVIEIFGGGSAGGSKTMCIGLLIAIFAKKYPGIRFYVARRSLKSLKQSTINTMITKVFPMLGIGRDEYIMHYATMELEFVNGSIVIFGELEYKPSDEDFARVGSLEVDIALVDEAGEISIQAKNAIKSRVGRGILTKDYGIPGKLILMANPSQNFLRTEYYDPYIQLGGGGLQKWQIGEIEIDGERKPAYRAFLRMGAYDNPFLPQSYIDNLKTLPDRERKRLLDGSWDYIDDDDMLFKSGLLDKAIVYELPPRADKVTKVIGVDVAAGAKDRTVYTLIENGIVTIQKVSTVTANWDKSNQQPIFRLMADELIEFAQRNGFTSREARNIAIEGNGIGQALITCIKERGWYATEYTATHKSRSENYYQLMLDMDSGDLKIYHELYGLAELRKELSGHTYTFVNQVPSVCKKDEVKLKLGKSPDLADSLEIACFAWHNITDKTGDQYNSNRIIW